MHVWEEWKELAFPRLNGQWALAIWDRRAKRLIIARDGLGIAPLFYAHADGQFVFASEVKALFAHPRIARIFDPVGLEQVFTYWCTVAPRTVFRGVYQLEPGHYGILDATGFCKTSFWRADFPVRGQELSIDTNVNARTLREKLTQATKLRCAGTDAPVGVYMSGGLDSAILAALLSQYEGGPLRTFSIRYPDPDFDEGIYQRQLSAALGTQHEEIRVELSDIANSFPEVIRYVETPLVRTAPAAMFHLSMLASQHGCKVIVSGEGADEILAGYDIFAEARVRLFCSRDPSSMRRSDALRLLYPWMKRSPALAPAFARSFFGRGLDPEDVAVSHRPRWESTSAIKSLLADGVMGARGNDFAEDVLGSLPSDIKSWDPLSRAQWLEMSTLMSGYVLSSQGDRVLMAHSVEGRFPFLDMDVVEFASQLPAWQKLMGLEGKYILKRAFEDIVPKEILERPKQPVRSPDAVSFFADGSPEWMPEVTSERAINEAGIFKPGPVGVFLKKCAHTGGQRLSNTDNMRALAILSTQLIHRSFIVENDWSAQEAALPDPAVAVEMLGGDEGEKLL
jgi:asparagine synthase (glutamine-hydrolysing)